MHKLIRNEITPSALQYLETCTQFVNRDKGRAKQRWKNARGTLAFTEIRERLSEMSAGRNRCMYCEDNQGTDIDHFEPLSLTPEKAYLWSNYLLACSHCNSNRKRDKFPRNSMGSPLLVDPSADEPFEHLELTMCTLKYAALSEKGLSTIEIFGLNRDLLVLGRKDALFASKTLVVEYAAQKKVNTASSNRNADLVLGTLKRASFSTVLIALRAMYENASPLLSDDVVDAFAAYPELLEIV